MNNNLPYFVHLGLPRTGSTWLQNLLTQHSQACLIFRPKFFNWDDNWQQGEKYYQTIQKEKLRQQNKIIVDSDEAYGVGHYILSTNWPAEKIKSARLEQISPFIAPADWQKIAYRIKKFNPQSKIIMVFRRQDDWLKSLYKYYLETEGEAWSLDEFLDSPRAGGKYFQSLNYYKIAKKYIELFGQQNVLILFFEDLKKDPQNFLDKITNFLKIESFKKHNLNIFNKKRQGMTHLGIKLMRQANQITQHLSHKRNTLYYKFIEKIIKHLDRKYFHKLPSIKLLNKKDQRALDQILKKIQPENKKLAKLIAKDLSKFGYY